MVNILFIFTLTKVKEAGDSWLKGVVIIQNGVFMRSHENYMKRAIELAKKGWGRTNPNPLVGAVIVKDGKIISEGFHEVVGGSHAEVCAINNADTSVAGSTMYVNLEPCSHYGRTPPCVKAIIEAGIKKLLWQ